MATLLSLLQVSRGYSAVSPTTDELQGYTATAVDEMLLQPVMGRDEMTVRNTAAGDRGEMR